MIIDTVDLIQSFKNPVADVYLKDGTVHSACDITLQPTEEFLTLVIDNVIFKYPVDEISHLEYYDAGI
jgi:hypothetical protein